MKIIHPCKKCIVRPVCNADCEIVNKYGEQLDTIIDSQIFLYSSIITSSLFIITIYSYLCYSLSVWWLTTIPVVWSIEYIILRHHEFDSSLKEESILATIASVLMVLPATWIIMLIVRWESYYDKYRPYAKEKK